MFVTTAPIRSRKALYNWRHLSILNRSPDNLNPFQEIDLKEQSLVSKRRIGMAGGCHLPYEALQCAPKSNGLP